MPFADRVALFAVVLALFLLVFHALGAVPARAAAPSKTAKSLATCGVNVERDKFGSLRHLPVSTLRSVYNKSLEEMDRLRNNRVKACWRQPWEELRDTFVSVAISAPKTALAPQALFRAGECQEALANCSHLGEDYRMALGLYESVARAFPSSVRADDALYACAQISARNLRDLGGARDYVAWIAKSFPRGDMAPKARALSEQLDRNGGAIADRQLLKNLVWTTDKKGAVEVRMDFTLPVQAKPRLVRGRENDLVVVELGDTEVVSEIARGLVIRDSLLESVRVLTPSAGRTRLELAFDDVARMTSGTRNRSVVIRVEPAASANAKSVAGKSSRPTAPVARAARSGIGSARTAALAASKESVRVVTIDAGHGGCDPGTMHNGIVERAVTLDVALRVGRLLTDNGIRVVYTRKKNRTVALARRSEIANENRADLFVSIHVNANPKPGVRGLEVYYYGDTGQTVVADRENGKSAAKGKPKVRTVALTQRVLDSRTLAGDVHRQMKNRLRKNGFGVASKGVKQGPFHVLGATSMPSVLAEIGYCTNDQDADLLKRADYRQTLAEGIVEGILAYRDRDMGRLTAEGGRRTTIQ